MNTLRGTVRYFDRATGNGLIISEDFSKAYYFTFKELRDYTPSKYASGAIQDQSSTFLKVCSKYKTGTPVLFSIEHTKHHTRAADIRLLA